MRRVVPSQIVETIDRYFHADMNTRLTVAAGNVPRLTVIVEMCDLLPSELWPDNSPLFLESVMAIRTALAEAAAIPGDKRLVVQLVVLQPLAGSQFAPVKTVFDLLKASPDERPEPSTHELRFITDLPFRALLRNDISSVNLALANSEWKAATVLAGSVVEALLLWELGNTLPATLTDCFPAVKLRSPGFPNNPSSDFEQWKLWEMIVVAGELGAIKKETVTQTALCKDFRNLIHPAKAKRLGVCDRGTALSAVAAVELIVRDLTAFHP